MDLCNLEETHEVAWEDSPTRDSSRIIQEHSSPPTVFGRRRYGNNVAVCEVKLLFDGRLVIVHSFDVKENRLPVISISASWRTIHAGSRRRRPANIIRRRMESIAPKANCIRFVLSSVHVVRRRLVSWDRHAVDVHAVGLRWSVSRLHLGWWGRLLVHLLLVWRLLGMRIIQ